MAERKALIQVAGQMQEKSSSDTLQGVANSTDIKSIVVLTQASYNALGSKDANTLYLING